MTSPKTGPMPSRAVCLRHPRHVWIANCPDCTAWYLAGLRRGADDGPRARVAGGDRDRAATVI